MSIIRFRFTGDTSSLDKASASAKKQLKQLKDEFKTGAAAATKWGLASAAAASAAGIAIYKSQSQIIDSLGKTADALDVSVEKLQALHHMAELNGVSAESMSKNMQRMEMRLGEAIRKGGLAAQALAEVGVSLNDIKQADPAQQMEMLAKAISGVQDQSVKASIASDLFGRDGLKMLKVLNNLQRDGLQPTIKELEALGVAMNRVDAAKVEAANDAVFRATQVIDGVAKKFTVEMAPIVEGLANVFIGAAKESNGFADSVDSAFDAIVSGAGFGMDAVDGVRRAFVVAGQAAATFALAIQRDSISIAKAIWDMPIDAVNTLIELINSLPGVDLDVIAPGQFSEAMQREIDLAAGAVEAGKQAMHETLMAPLPSEAFKKFVEDAQAASQEAAEALAESGMIGPVGGTGEDGEDGTEREKIKAKLEAIQEGYKSEIELAREKFGEEQEVLAEALEAKLLTEDEYRKASLDAENAYKDAQLKIQEESEARKTAIQKAQSESRKRALGDALSQMTTLMNTESRKQFEIGKAAAIAQTVIETYSAAQKAFSSLAGIPIVGPALGAAAAAAAIAGGVARVNSIRSQSMGGSGTPSNTPTQQVNADSTPVGSAASSGGGQSVGNTTIALPLDGIVMDMAGLIRLLNEAQENGEGSINFVGV